MNKTKQKIKHAHVRLNLQNTRMHRLAERITKLENLMDVEPEEEPIDVSKTAIINAIWEQNANRSKEDITIAINEIAYAPHIKGFPEPRTFEDIGEPGSLGIVDDDGKPMCMSKGSLPEFWNDSSASTPIDKEESARDYQEIDVSTENLNWEELYYQSQKTNVHLRQDNQELNLKLKAISDMLHDYEHLEMGS